MEESDKGSEWFRGKEHRNQRRPVRKRGPEGLGGKVTGTHKIRRLGDQKRETMPEDKTETFARCQVNGRGKFKKTGNRRLVRGIKKYDNPGTATRGIAGGSRPWGGTSGGRGLRESKT